VIVPIIVFRNHRRFHPLRQEGGSESLKPGLGEERSTGGKSMEGGLFLSLIIFSFYAFALRYSQTKQAL
jgi:hypothetical protein